MYDIQWEQVLDPLARDTLLLFTIIHNIVPNKERVHRFHMIASPNCFTCGVIANNVHIFCECESVREAWFWLRQRILGLMSQNAGIISNFEFLNLMFDSSPFEREILWFPVPSFHVQIV